MKGGKQNMTEKSFALSEFLFSHDIFCVSKADIDISGDLIAGIVLSRIIYWFSPDKNGKSKIRVVKKDGEWLAKAREDWYEETRLSPKQLDRALKILKDKNLIETALHRFNGSPTLHLRPNWETYNQKVKEWKQNKAEEIEKAENKPFLPFGENPFLQKGKMEIDEKVKTLTNTTTNITSNITNIDNKECISETEIHNMDSELEINAGQWQWKSTRQYSDYIKKIMPKYIQNIAQKNFGKNSQQAYDFLLSYTTLFFLKYRQFNGKLHPWYKEETLKLCYNETIKYFFDTYNQCDMELINDFINQFFEHDGMKDKPLAVFATHGMLEHLRKEIEQDWY